jgi:hypothetical protein
MFEPAIDHFGNSVKFQPLHLPPQVADGVYLTVSNLVVITSVKMALWL